MSNVAPPGFVHNLIDHALHRNHRLNGDTQQQQQQHLSSHPMCNGVAYENNVNKAHFEVLVRS
jgi:hypothetical protein